MKTINFHFLFLAPVFLFWACTSLVPPMVEESPAVNPVEEKSSVPELPSAFTDGLASARFRNLPPEAKDYLFTLAEAFRKKDKNFLFSQGETQYEKETRNKYDEETYLAMLYRTGPYSEDSDRMSVALPRLDYSLVRGIEYLRYEERGPLLEIRGRIHLENKEVIPCGIMLIWRLQEPKILGIYP